MDNNKLGRIVATVALVVMGAVAGLVGAYFTWISNCCGSPNASDSTGLVLGFVVFCGFCALAALRWRHR